MHANRAEATAAQNITRIRVEGCVAAAAPGPSRRYRKTYTEIPNKSPRARLPAAIAAPEYRAAIATLSSKMINNVSSAIVSASGSQRHSAERRRPIQTPAAAASTARCGPVFPNRKGSGGSSNAIPKKTTSQRQEAGSAGGSNAAPKPVKADRIYAGAV